MEWCRPPTVGYSENNLHGHAMVQFGLVTVSVDFFFSDDSGLCQADRQLKLTRTPCFNKFDQLPLLVIDIFVLYANSHWLENLSISYLNVSIYASCHYVKYFYMILFNLNFNIYPHLPISGFSFILSWRCWNPMNSFKDFVLILQLFVEGNSETISEYLSSLNFRIMVYNLWVD